MSVNGERWKGERSSSLGHCRFVTSISPRISSARANSNILLLEGVLELIVLQQNSDKFSTTPVISRSNIPEIP